MTESIKQYNKIYVNGEWVTPKGTQRIDVVNPASEKVIASVALGNSEDVNSAVRAARSAFELWSKTSSEERAQYIERITEELRKRFTLLSDAIVSELGVPRWFCDEVQVDDPIDAMSKHQSRTTILDIVEEVPDAKIVREPIGVCSMINPWNYPLSQFVSKVAPALAAGCTVVVKPSEVTPIHAIIAAEAIHAAGLPKGVFNLVNGTGPEVGEPMCVHPEVDMVSFTGSRAVGIKVTQLAAESIKRVCLELGGKSPFLIAKTKKLEEAAKVGIEDLMVNTGQSCNALTRILVHESQYEEFLVLAKNHAESLSVGDPLKEGTFMGPMVSEQQRQRVLAYIQAGINDGARLITGGVEKPVGCEVGHYVRPTIFADVTQDMSILTEEIFGPVVCVIPYVNEEEAIHIANDTIYGLSARVWSDDQLKAQEIAAKLRAGQVYINDGHWNNAAPFGGFKQSGNGRELGDQGVHEYIEYKSLQF